MPSQQYSNVMQSPSNPLSELHRSIIIERQQKKGSQKTLSPPSLDKLEQGEAAKIFKDTIFLERQLEAAKGNLAMNYE